MKPRAALAALVATITVFAWQTVSHMALPWHHVTVMSFKNPEAVEKVLVENANDPGMYMLPWADHHDEETMKKATEQWDNGFSMFAAVRPNGSNSMESSLAQQFLWNLLGALLIAFLLGKLNLKGTACKVGITVSFALFTVVCGILPNWTWWGFGNAYVAVAIADILIAWSLAGLVLAKMIPHQADLADESEPESVNSN
jgi:hypothetical protein